MSERWYYQLLGEEFGPASPEVITELLESNQITPEDYVRASSEDNWVQLKSLPQDTFGPSLEYAGIDDLDEIQLTDSSALSESEMPVSSASLEFADLSDLDSIDLSNSSTDIPQQDALQQEVANPTDLDQIAVKPAEIAVDIDLGNDLDIDLGNDLDINLDDDLDFDVGDEGDSFEDAPPVEETSPEESSTEPTATASSLFQDNVAPPSDRESSQIRPERASTASPSVSPERPTSPTAAPPPQPQPSPAKTDVWAQMLAATDDTSETKQKKRPSVALDKRLVVGLVVGVLLVGWLYFPDLRTYDSQFEALDRLIVEFQGMRNRKASSAEWDQFIKSSEGTIATITEELENESGGNQKSSMIRRYLMFAARDYWPEMVQDAREEPNKAEERFLYCLTTVKNLRADLPPPPPPADETLNGTKALGEQ